MTKAVLLINTLETLKERLSLQAANNELAKHNIRLEYLRKQEVFIRNTPESVEVSVYAVFINGVQKFRVPSVDDRFTQRSINNIIARANKNKYSSK